MYSHDVHMYTCIEVILSVHKDQQSKLVVIQDRAVLQVHHDIFSVATAISEAYVKLKLLLCQFQDSDPSFCTLLLLLLIPDVVLPEVQGTRSCHAQDASLGSAVWEHVWNCYHSCI